MAPNPQEELERVASVVPCSDLLPVDEHPQRHVGYEITATADRIFLDISSFIRGLPNFETEIDGLGPEYARRALSPIHNLPLFEDPCENHIDAFPASHVHLMQRAVGSLCWLATCHPAVSSRHGELASCQHRPTARAFRILKGILKELGTEGLHPLELQPVRSPQLRLWVDCAVHNHQGRRAWVVQLADSSWPLTNRTNLIHWASKRDRLKHASSTAGEVNAMLQALEEGEDCFLLVSLLFPECPIRLLTDSQSGILQILNGGHTITARERAGYIRQLLAGLPLESLGLEHVPGELQLADPLTKPKALSWFISLDKTV